jgi:hypothetical protein
MSLTDNQKKLGALILENGFSPLDVVLHYVDLYNTDRLYDDVTHTLYKCFTDGFLRDRKLHHSKYTLVMEPVLIKCFWEFVGKFKDKNHDTIVEKLKTYPKYDSDQFCGEEYGDYSFWIAEQIVEELNLEWFWK